MSNVEQIQVNVWDKRIKKLTKNKDVEGLRKYKEVIKATVGISDSLKSNYIDKCTEAINGINANIKINSDNVKVGKNARHIKSRKKTAGFITGLALSLGVTGVGYVFAGCGNSAQGRIIEGQVTESQIDSTNTEVEALIEETLKPTLSFDAEDTEVMISNLKEFVKNAIPNGIELTDAELEEQVESLVNYYVWLNLNEMGPTYLSELYQTDSISYIEIFSDSMYWANVIRFDSMTSSEKDNSILDLSKMISNKKDLELVQSFLSINARLHDAVDANNVESIRQICEEYQSLIETKLLDHVSYRYGQGAMDLCFRLVYTGEQLLANYDMVIMDESLAKIINEDEFLTCLYIIAGSTAEDKTYSNDELKVLIENNTSKKSDNVIYQVDLLKDYMSRLNMQLDFTGKKSVANVMVEVSEYVRTNNLLSTYVPNESLEEFFNRNYDQTHVPVETVKPSDTIVDTDGDGEKDSYIDEEEMGDAENQEEYEEEKREEIEDQLDDEDSFTNEEDEELEHGDDAEEYAEDYSKGYTAGSKQGAIDGNALATKNPTTTGSKGYVDGYAAGYSESYEEAKQARIKAEEDIKVEEEELDEPKEESTEIIESGDVDVIETEIVPEEDTQENTQDNNQEDIQENTQDNNQEDIQENTEIIEIETEVIIEEEVIEEEIIEEGIIEQGIVESTNQYTISDDELRQFYMDYYLALSAEQAEESYQYTKK